MIDWTKLKPYRGCQHKSFEELCYQIAEGLFGKEGIFSNIDDSGGGDGVEFFLTCPNGHQWGWQAKFFLPGPQGTLNDGGRKTQIEKSLLTACKKHPALQRWYLCTPRSFTPKEQKWFDEKLKQKIPRTHSSLDIIHWTESDFLNWLGEPRFGGMKNYFFGELELTWDWFEAQLKASLADIGDKYVPGLHVDINGGEILHKLLADCDFVERYQFDLRSLEKNLAEFVSKKQTLHVKDPENTFPADLKKGIVDSAEKLELTVSSGLASLRDIFNCLYNERLDRVIELNPILKAEEIFDALMEYSNSKAISDFKSLEFNDGFDSEYNETTKVIASVNEMERLVTELIWSIQEVPYDLELPSQPDLHILGDAHTGKTHMVCDLCYQRISIEAPGLLIPGRKFRTCAPLREQIIRILDIPKSYSWHDFLEALSSAAKVYLTRIPIIIDGLNEAIVDGKLSPIWKDELAGIIQDISQYPYITLITTCRSTYRDEIWPGKKPEQIVETHGFEGSDLRSAVESYFEYYKIDADLRSASLAHFRHPIYLKIFCETLNHDRSTKKAAYVGNQSVFEIFEEFLQDRKTAVSTKLRKHPKLDLLSPALERIAAYLWENDSRELSKEVLASIVDSTPLEILNWDNSLSRLILDEGLLLNRDAFGGEERISFTYDLMAGYLIAKHLIADNWKDEKTWTKLGLKEYHVSDEKSERANININDPQDEVGGLSPTYKTKYNMGTDNEGPIHPLFEDIKRCLAVLVTTQTGRLLHQYVPGHSAKCASLKALFEISVDNFHPEYEREVRELFKDVSTQGLLLNEALYVMGIPRHPLNALFWTELLKTLSMSERDILWTELLRKNSDWAKDTITLLEQLSLDDQTTLGDFADRRDLLGIQVMWMLTSTVRWLRDKATSALYWYGRLSPVRFFDLVVDSLTINDPYISERMLAAAYGVAMAKKWDFQDPDFSKEILPKYARSLYEKMFSPQAPHATTHILARDYASKTIKLALLDNPVFLSLSERERSFSPFCSDEILDWQEIQDNYTAYDRPYSGPIRRDFANYTIGRLVKGRGPYDDDHQEYRKVLRQIGWRVQDLGYSEKLFDKVDELIGRKNFNYGRAGNGRKTDRYGKKYSWIAYYEMAGFLQDHNQLKGAKDFFRFSDCDIDPSFPENERDYQLVTEDFLGNTALPLGEWITNGTAPDVKKYLIMDDLSQKNDQWVLLDGFLDQANVAVQRKTFVCLRGLIVHRNDVQALTPLWRRSYESAKAVPRPPEDWYLFAGEIPWAYTSDHSGKAKIVGDQQSSEKQLFEVIVPVRQNVWREYKSSSNFDREVTFPVNEITGHLNLVGQPQSFDLYEVSGAIASISTSLNVEGQSSQYFTYLRRDLLDRFLSDTESQLVWVIWGEREPFIDGREHHLFVSDQRAKGERPWGEFHSVKIYE